MSGNSVNGTIRDLKITHSGEEEYYDKDEGDFGTREVVEVRCETMDDARAVGAVVSLLKRHEPEDIRAAVEEDNGE